MLRETNAHDEEPVSRRAELAVEWTPHSRLRPAPRRGLAFDDERPGRRHVIVGGIARARSSTHGALGPSVIGGAGSGPRSCAGPSDTPIELAKAGDAGCSRSVTSYGGAIATIPAANAFAQATGYAPMRYGFLMQPTSPSRSPMSPFPKGSRSGPCRGRSPRHLGRRY